MSSQNPDFTHEHEQGGKYFVDTYSRVDMAPVTELRDGSTGELVCELQRENTSESFQGSRLTERFVAKGRVATGGTSILPHRSDEE